MQDSFGQQLKSWRNRRRLSQLDLGMTANVSARHISFLETGRARPSQSMILQLSESLAIPRENRNDLLNAAGFVARYAARPLEDEDMRFVRSAISWTLNRHNPYPGIALDRHWRIVDTNACAEALLAPMGVQVGDSLLQAMSTDTPFAEALENKTEVLSHLVYRLRAESRYLGGDAILEASVNAIESSLDSDSVDRSGTLPAVITANYRIGEHLLSFFSTISQFGSTEDVALADMKLELMFPANDLTKNSLLQMAGDADTEPC